MWEFDENNLPEIRTRRALLVLDVQNDFLANDSLLPVQSPPDFLENIRNLTPPFRPAGFVFWIQTLFQTSRPINGEQANGEKIITDREIQRRVKGVSQTFQKELDNVLRDDGAELERDSKEKFLTIDAGQDGPFLLRSSPGIDLYRDGLRNVINEERDFFIQKTHYSAFRDGALVQSLRGKFVTEIYICGVLTNISIFATAMEAAKHGYTITLVEDCLGYRSKLRHDEALRHLVRMTGCEVMSSKDLIEEFQAEAEAAAQQPASTTDSKNEQRDADLEKAMSSLQLTGSASTKTSCGPSNSREAVAPAESTSSDSLSVSTLLQGVRGGQERLSRASDEAGSKQKPERVKSKPRVRRHASHSTKKEVEDSVGRSSPTKSDSIGRRMPTGTLATKDDSLEEAALEDKRPRTSADITSARVSKDKDSIRGETAASTIYLEQETQRSHPVSEPLCEGDTSIIYDVVPEEEQDGIFERLRDEVLWQKMSHQGGDVPRLIGVQGEVQKDGSIPIYRHPSDESPSLLPFTPTVLKVRKHVEAFVGHEVNHVLIQLYRSGTDYISEHSDKTLDIAPNTFIANVSFGAERMMVFRTKKPLRDSNASDEPDIVSTRQSCRSSLPHNSMCKMGLKTNMRWLHGIRQDKRMAKERTPAELAFQGARISLTFRKIGTFLDQTQHKMIWGQGATSKSKDTAKPVINGETPEAKALLLAFGKENHSSDFDWQEAYGQGYDVLHLTNKCKLYCAGDNIADLRIKFMLAEYKFDWVEGALSTPFRWKDFDSKRDCITRSVGQYPPITFIDNRNNTTVTGEYAIMLYLEAVGGSAKSKTPLDLSIQLTRFQQATQLLRVWRAQPFSIQPLQLEARLWVSYASNSKFIAGDTISVADFSLFPVLLEISEGWDDNDDGFEDLAKYWMLMRTQDCVVKILGPIESDSRLQKFLASAADQYSSTTTPN